MLHKTGGKLSHVFFGLEVSAVTTEYTKALLIPTQYIQDWMCLYPSWRAFALQLYNLRFEELLKIIEGIAFRKMDERLVKYLEQKAAMEGKAELSITHQAIATDLGTFREVISRLLKQLEKNRKYLAFPKFFKNFRLCVTFITHFVEDRLYLYTINLFNY